MPQYVTKSIKQLNHKLQKKQHEPYPSTPIIYGAKKQYATPQTNATLLDRKVKKFIHKMCGEFIFLGRASDSTLLCPISAIASNSATAIGDTMKQTQQILDYIAIQEESELTFKASDMKLATYSDASYFSELKSCSRAGGHLFLSRNSNIMQKN